MATFLTIRYGRVGSDGRRPNTLNLSSPLWLLAGPPRRVQRERLLKTGVQDGSLVESLGQDPAMLTLRLMLRPSEEPGTQAQAALNRVRLVTGHEMSLEIGGEDWGDGWRLEDLREEYPKWNLPADQGTAAARTFGGIAVVEAVVELVLVKETSGRETVGLPAALSAAGVFDDDE